MTINERIDLILKPLWSRKDIENYFDVCRSHSFKMFERTILVANGKVDEMPNKVKSDAVIKLYTLHTREDEIKLMKEAMSIYEKR